MRRNCTSVFKLIILCIIAISTTVFLYKTYNVNRIEIIQPHFADKQRREPEKNVHKNEIETEKWPYQNSIIFQKPSKDYFIKSWYV